MAIKLFNTKAFGQIIGDVEESLYGTKLLKPAFVQLQPDPQTQIVGYAMMSIMSYFVESDENHIMLKEDDVVGGDLTGYTPNTDVYNEYQKRFGTGFTLHTTSSIK